MFYLNSNKLIIVFLVEMWLSQVSILIINSFKSFYKVFFWYFNLIENFRSFNKGLSINNVTNVKIFLPLQAPSFVTIQLRVCSE